MFADSRCLLLTGMILVGALSASPAAARADATWSVQPSGPDGPSGRNYFVYTLSPGRQLIDHVGITNLGARPLTLRVYATDAFNAADGAFALLTAERSPSDVGSWIAFNRSDHTVQPGQRVDIPFRLTVPNSAAPGDHVGGVIAAVAGEQTTPNGQRLKVDRRVAARVYLRVSGPLRHSLQVESISVRYDNPVNPLKGGNLVASYRVRNTGNVRLAARLSTLITGPFGWELARGHPQLPPELLPGNTYTVTERIPAVLPAGRLTTQVTIGSGSGTASVTRTASVWAVPWTSLLAALFVIALGAFLERRRRGSRTR